MTAEDRLRETVLASRRLLDGKLLQVHEDTVLLPDGRQGLREWIRHPGAVAVIAHRREEDRVVLVRQYRHPVGRILWELPAGKLDPGEAVEACGRRELEEETGWRAGQLEAALTLLPCIGYSNEVIHVLYTEELTSGQRRLDQGEFLEVRELALPELRGMVERGEIEDGKTLVALYWLFARLDRTKAP
ncbi:MAG: NUDIX hydrolase [bacterium]|jgi:ADP-ribose pyrophosphatase|nr:NUDIX hydrolase [bacterium]